MNNQEGFAIWLTGMSGAGKTTLANKLKEEFLNRGLRVESLDGDAIRKVLGRGLGFSREDRITNLEQAAFIANLIVKHGVIVICSYIMPYEESRRYIRKIIDRYVEVYIKCPLEVLIQRDPKGLYKKALAGEVKHFTGISDPFEEPQNFEICVETNKKTIEESMLSIINWLESNKFIQKKSIPKLSVL